MISLEEYRKILEEKEKELIDLQEKSAESEKPVDLDQPIGRISRIDAIQRQQQALHAKGRTANSLRLVREALKRIENGTYGKCGRCEGDIEPERLEYMPETTICVKCMREMKA